jgi:hypothetical protein
MDIARAARILGVEAGASRVELERAYRRRASESHPDRFAGESAERVAAASAEFQSVGEAFATLSAAPVPLPLAPVLPLFSRTFVIAWMAVLALGVVLAITGGPTPFGTVENIVRTMLIAGGLVGYVVRGHRAFFAIALVALAATALFTLTHATFGALLALLVIEPSAIALLIAGRRVERRVERQRERS